MYWIALKMLVGDRAKFLGIVLGLTFAAALITQQGSIFCGLMLRTCAQITDITGADLWVMDPSVKFRLSKRLCPVQSPEVRPL